jgi:hypothetical protein
MPLSRSNHRRIRRGLACSVVLLLGAAAWRIWQTSSPAPRGLGEFEVAGEATVIPLKSGPSWQERDDPSRDGWDSEAWSQEAQKQLDLLARLVLHPEEIDEARLHRLAAEEFSSGPLRPETRRTVFEDSSLKVERAEIDPRTLEEEEGSSHRGAEGLRKELRSLSVVFQGAEEARFKLKIVRVEDRRPLATTRQLLEALSRKSGTLLEENAAWTIRWTAGGGGAPPRMRWIGVEDYQAASRRSGQPLFADCTGWVLGKNGSYRRQLLHGFNEWLSKIQDPRFFSILGTPGLAVGDVNGDGMDDLYLGQEGGLPNRLFLQRPDGTAEDVSEGSGADWIESTRGVLLLDLDGDGCQDLAAATLGGLVIASGDGKGRFSTRSVLPTSHDTMSLSAADYDLDGDLDLYVCAYRRDDLLGTSTVLSIDSSADFLYHDANDGAPNVLFQNDGPRGAWKFSDVTRAVGLDENNRRYSFASSWEDFDNDGDPDLYVANDFGLNNLYRNELAPSGAARFRDVAQAAGAEDRAASMSVSWGDFNRDGWMDLYVGNMFSAAGGRITTQAAFQPGAPAEVRAHLERFARGNTLLENRGGLTFADVSLEAGVTMGRWAWSSNFMDLNNDGFEDLFVANGYLTTEDTGDL